MKGTSHEISSTTEKVFTTGRKPRPRSTINVNRKGSIVKERCRQLTKIALNLYPNRIISHEDLSFLVISYIGGDKETVRAYMGYHGFVKHSTQGGISRVIGKMRKGYLEKFGFMHRKGRYWVIHAQKTLFPPDTPLSLNNEGCRVNDSKEKISFSTQQDADAKVKVVYGHIGSNNNNNNTEKERNFTPKNLGDCRQHCIRDEELLLLNAMEKQVEKKGLTST